MSLKKQRIHQSGYANVDFRTQRDTKSLELFQPWKIASHYGTMNDYGFRLPWEEKKRRFEVSKELNTIKDLNAEAPDPRFYRSVEFYKKNKIPVGIRQIYTLDRLAQLDESEKGKDKYFGDSMMIADINKMRKERKKRRRGEKSNEERRKEELKQSIIKEKDMKNKEAEQETQLVKIDAEDTLEGKVDIKKILEIRLALRRRYAHRENIPAIFHQWQRSMSSEITVKDAHQMINDLCIPINFNETRALIASANKRGTDDLNLAEFMDLIFSDNEALNLDLKKIKFKDESLYNEGEQMDDLKKNMKLKLIEKNKEDALKFLDAYFKTKKPLFINKLKEVKGNKIDLSQPFVDFETFNSVMQKFSLPQKYLEHSLLKAIYEKYKDPSKDQMNYINYLDYCMNLKDLNNFFDSQEKNLDLIEDKIIKCRQRAEETKGALIQKLKEEEILKNSLENQINEFNEKKERQKIKHDKVPTFNHYEPSKNFCEMIFANSDKYFEARNKIEAEFDPSLSLMAVNQRKTRFGGNPPFKDTFPTIRPRCSSPSYFPEKKRFEIETEPLAFREKAFSIQKKKAVEDRIKNSLKEYNTIILKNEDLDKAKRNISDYFKAQRKLKYEKINKERNDIIE